MGINKLLKILGITVLLDILLTVVAIFLFGVPEDTIIVIINITIFVLLLSLNLMLYRKEKKIHIVTITLLSPLLLKTVNEYAHGDFSLSLTLSFIILCSYVIVDDKSKNN